MNPVTITIKKWLREQLLPLVNVRRCTFVQLSVAGEPVREADLVVHTWAGVLVLIHLIDEPVKASKIRRILEHATGTGIASLFLLDAALLPRPGERVEGEKWYMVFQQLANDRIYTYRIGKNGPEIRSAQFVSAGRRDNEIRYGPALPIQQLRYLRHTVKHAAVKGYWLLADFETEHSARIPAYRFADHAQQNTAGNTGKASQNHNSAPPEPSAATITRLESCYQLLGVSRNATRDDVKAAFRRLAFEVHPDVSNLPKAEAEARFKVLSEAYEYIKVTNSWP